MRDRIIELGGEIKTGTIITGVQPANHTVVDDKHNSYTYKNLIWAADLKTLYSIAETQNLSDDIRSTIRGSEG